MVSEPLPIQAGSTGCAREEMTGHEDRSPTADDTAALPTLP